MKCGGEIMDRKKEWLCYLLNDCEQGSEGWSSWMYYGVALGNTEEEIARSWAESVKATYDVDFTSDLKCYNGHWFCDWFRINMHELKTSVYGHSEPIKIEFPYEKHPDRFGGAI